MTSENGIALHLDIAGLSQEVFLTEREQSDVIHPVITRLQELYIPGKRSTAFLAGSPGTGKSTFSAIIEHRMPADIPFQILPADGFHYPNNYLDTHFTSSDGHEIPLREVKGAPETFDAQQLLTKLQKLKTGEPVSWPVYDRRLHDPVENAIQVLSEGVILIEGNYLLLDKKPWDEMVNYADVTIFLNKPLEAIRKDVISRHMRSKSWDYDRAAAFFDTSDGKNANLIINSQIKPPDMLITVTSGNKYAGISP